jgi:hypothetical protein
MFDPVCNKASNNLDEHLPQPTGYFNIYMKQFSKD